MKRLFYILPLLLIFACNIQPQEINYGEDACHFCRMTIVDKQHAAEIVTSKGKAFKFDASECMINHLAEIDSSTVGLFLINDFNSPGELIDATKATFIISKNLPSPMGGFLSGVSSKEEAEALQKEKEGTLYSWNELLTHYKNK
ncbi:MAG: nitrous oxide reductase accessory protein NosL [Flavobacteriaceae bacterium]|nr:nitrous oxide reductase accessory protein NosL [Flavobacteriaceae bacterium]